MRRIFCAVIAPWLLIGCSSLNEQTSISALIENSGRTQPPLSSYERGKRELQLGRIGLAVDAFETALRETPDSISVLNGLAIAYDRLGRSEIAERYLAQALALDENSAVTLNNMALLKLEQGDTAQAEAYMARAKQAVANDTNMTIPGPIGSAIMGNLTIADRLSMSAGALPPVAPRVADPRAASSIRSVGSGLWHLETDIPASEERREAISDGPPLRSEQQEERQDHAGTVPTVQPQPLSWSARTPATTVVRVSNGTGRSRMAAHFRSYFTSHGLKIRHIANAPSYDFKRSMIFYNPDQEAVAEEVARALPFPVVLAKASKATGQIEIVLGSDLLGFDDRLQRGEI